MDLLTAGGTNLQDMYNVAVMDAVNEELGIAQQSVRLHLALLRLPCRRPSFLVHAECHFVAL